MLPWQQEASKAGINMKWKSSLLGQLRDLFNRVDYAVNKLRGRGQQEYSLPIDGLMRRMWSHDATNRVT